MWHSREQLLAYKWAVAPPYDDLEYLTSELDSISNSSVTLLSRKAPSAKRQKTQHPYPSSTSPDSENGDAEHKEEGSSLVVQEEM